MPVVTAGVHFAAIAGSMFETVLFLDMERVHIGAQCNAVSAIAAAQNTDDASFRQSTMYLDPSVLQQLSDQLRRRGFFKCSFWVLVYLSAPPPHIGMQRLYFRNNVHN